MFWFGAKHSAALYFNADGCACISSSEILTWWGCSFGRETQILFWWFSVLVGIDLPQKALINTALAAT